MPTTTYLGDTYITPFDPAYVDLWGAPLNTLFISHDAGIGRAYAGGSIVNPITGVDYGIAPAVRFPCTVKSVEFYTDAGTLTAATKINGANITSLDAVSVNASPNNSTTATGANTMVAGDGLTLSFSAVNGVTVLYYSYIIDRTGVGSA